MSDNEFVSLLSALERLNTKQKKLVKETLEKTEAVRCDLLSEEEMDFIQRIIQLA